MSGETVYHPLLEAMFGCPNLAAKRHLETAARILRGCAGVQAELARKRLQRLRRLDGEIAEPERRIGTLVEASGSDLPSSYVADGGYWNGQVDDELVGAGTRLLVRPNGRPRTRCLPPSPSVARMERRLAHPTSRGRYRRRQALVEPVIAQLKIGRRLDRFHVRGLAWCRARVGARLRGAQPQTALPAQPVAEIAAAAGGAGRPSSRRPRYRNHRAL